MSVDYKQLKKLVLQELGTDGPGGMAASAPQDIPIRMPSAGTETPEQDQGDKKANEMYDIALIAREAAEELVEALDGPIFDNAYEHAFKASASLRRALNSLEEVGAHPMPDQRVVPPPPQRQKYFGGSMGGYAGDAASAEGGIQEAPEELKGFGVGTVTQSAHGLQTKNKGAAVAAGDVLQGVDVRERKLLLQIEDILTDVADKVDLVKYRPILGGFLTQFLNKVRKDPAAVTQKDPDAAITGDGQ